MKKETPECLSGRHDRTRRAAWNTPAKAWLAASLRGGVSLLSCGIGFTGVAMADERKKNPLNLDKVTVTATRTKQDVDKAPASTTVVTQEEMQRKHAPTLDEALRNEVGVHVLKFRGPVDNHTTTIMRGFQGQQRTLLMLDGIPLNSAITGSVPWSELPVDEIERVEVVRGPYSALYGGYALGGVINSIVATPQKETARARAGYGTFGTSNYHLQYGNRILSDRLSFIVGFDRWQTDGYVVSTIERPRGTTPVSGGEIPVTGYRETRDVTGQQTLYTVGDGGRQKFDRDSFIGKISFDPTPYSNLSLIAQYGEWSLDQPTYNTYLRNSAGVPVTSGNLDIEGNRVTLSESNFFPITRKNEAGMYALKYSIDISPAITFKANLGYSKQFNRETEFRALPAALGLGSSRWTTRDRDSDAIHAEVLGNFQLGERNLLTAGLLYQTADGKQKIPVIFDRRVPEVIGLASASGGKQETQAIYIQDQLKVLDNLNLFLGARYDRWSNTDGFQELGPNPRTRFSDRSQTSFNPKLSVVYSPLADTTLRASAATAFRPPTLDELYVNSSHGTTQTIGNPNLKPEKVTSWEVGIVQYFPTATRVGATYYNNTLKDLIYRRATTPPGAPLTIQVLENAAEGETKGIEFDVLQRITPYLNLVANATWLDATITSSPNRPELAGKTIPQIPKHIYNIGIDLNAKDYKGSLMLRRVGDAFSRDDNTDVARGVRGGIDPYTTLDAKAVYAGWQKVSLSLSVMNILDKRYFQSFGQMPGRSVFGELIVKF